MLYLRECPVLAYPLCLVLSAALADVTDVRLGGAEAGRACDPCDTGLVCDACDTALVW